jgi:hypothetical protein
MFGSGAFACAERVASAGAATMPKKLRRVREIIALFSCREEI